MLKLFTGGHGSILPLIALLLFITMFALVVAYLASDRRRHHHRAMARLPLADAAPDEDHDHG